MNLKYFFLLVMLIFLVGCIEKELDFDSIKSQNWSSEWAFPLINSSITIHDLINDSTAFLYADEDGLLILVYKSQEFFSFTGNDLPFIPDQQKILAENFYVPDLLPGNNAHIPVTFLYELETDEPGARIDSANLKGGYFTIEVTTDLNKNDASVQLTLPGLIENSTGKPVNFTFDISNSGAGGLIKRDTTIELANHTLVFNQFPSPSNELTIEALVHVSGDNNPNNSPYFMELRNSYSDLGFSRSFGYMGQLIVEMKDTIILDVFDVNEQGNFTFGPGSVNLLMDVDNSFGIPVLMDIVSFRAFHFGSENDSTEIFIFGEGNPAQFFLNYPTISQIGQSILTEVNTQNSNISEAIEISPDRICIDIDGHFNPAADSATANFILDSSAIQADITVEMSLFGGISGFKISDTIDFNLGNIDEISSLLMVVDAENGYPIDAIVQLSFVDSLYQVVHELMPPGEMFVNAAPIGSPPEYRVTGSVKKITNVELTEAEIQTIQKSKKIIINATLSTTNGELMKIYDDYQLGLKIGAKVGIDY